MPQLWVETFVSQYFWLLLTFLTLYLFIYNFVLPNISLSYKARNIQQNVELVIKEEQNENELAKNITNLNQTTTNIEKFDNVDLLWFNTNPQDAIKDTIENSIEKEDYFEFQDWEISWDAEDDNIEISEEDFVETL